jgi:predicted anti-sigma-YlaC factor YlaD
MKKECIDFSVGGNLPLYILGKLSKEEKSQFEQHLKNCSECRQDRLFKCVNTEVGILLPLFGTNELKGKERQLVEKHFMKCWSCLKYFLDNFEFYTIMRLKRRRFRNQFKNTPEEMEKKITLLIKRLTEDL